MADNTSIQGPPKLTLKERHKLIFGTWNVTSLKKNDSLVLDELEKYNVDIACIQETKYEEGTFEIGDYTLVTKCYEKGMIYGLGFMIKKTLFKYIEIEEDQTDRICFLKLRTDAGIVHIINVYFPQNFSKFEKVEKKEDCFLALEDKLLQISEKKIVFILGDFNSHIGSDSLAWFRCLGEHGIPCEVNDNGQRLLEFCTFYDLGITHSFFDQTENAQYTFQSRSKHKTYIDFCITRNKHRHFVKMTKSNLPSQTLMDHLLVTSDIELSLSLNKENCQDKTLSKSQFLLVSTFVILSCQSQQKNYDVEEKWQEIKKKLFPTEPFDKLYEENFSKFKKQLKEISVIYNSVINNNNGRMTEKERLGFGCIIKEIVQNYEDDSNENIEIPEQIMLDLLNSAINEGMASNVDDTDILFQDLPTLEEIEKLIENVEGQIDVKAILRPNVLILQQLYELCWTSEYIPLELSFVGLAYHKQKTAADNNNVFNLSYLIGHLYVFIMLVRVKKLRNKEINEHCVSDCESKSELLFQLCRHQEQHQKEDKELYRGFVSILDNLEHTNTVFFEHLSKLNTPIKLLNILSSVIPFLQCSNYLCSEKYFWHRDAKAHCCSMDTILSDLSWSLVNKCLIKSKFTGNLSFVASYLNTVVIETQSGESLKYYLSLLQQICQSKGFQMSKPQAWAHNVKNSNRYKATSKEFRLCSRVKYLDLIFSSDNEFDSEISYRISKSSIILSNILKKFSTGTEENYMTIMSQFEKLVLEELSTNSEHFVMLPGQEKTLEDFRKKCIRRIKFFCGICRPSFKTLLSVKRLQFRKKLPSFLEDKIDKKRIDRRNYHDYHTQSIRDAEYHRIDLNTILDVNKDEKEVKRLLESTSRKIKWRENLAMPKSPAKRNKK
ncbi:uncharacterized protein LOC106053289 isoform X2 [Biomphalaria glabrata]|nr:uncharacterized protein LOC106053289 isoform X2 [Biomphalaria glabrata]